MLTVCTEIHCPIHNPKVTARSAANQTAATPNTVEAQMQAAPNPSNHDQIEREELENEQERKAEERRQQREREFQRQREEHEAEEARLDAVRAARAATFERILENAPATLSATQLRVLLRALVNLDPHTFIDDLAGEIVGDNENEQRPAEEIVLSAIDEAADDQLTRFALRLVLTGHLGIPREGETDFLAEAATAFAPPPTARMARTKKPTPIKAASTATHKKKPAKKRAAA